MKTLQTVGLVLCLTVPAVLCIDCSWFQLRQINKGEVLSFTSPNYPSNYPALHKCFAKFSPASSDVTVRLICNDVDIYRDSGVFSLLRSLLLGYDWVFLATSGYVQGFPSGDAVVPTSWSASGGNSIVFSFATNLFDSGRGFSCTVIGDTNDSPARTCGQKGAGRSGRSLLQTLGNQIFQRLSNRTRQLLIDDNKVFGGSPSAPNEWPWMVFLVVPLASGDIGYCGGTIISESYILTAAHCLDQMASGAQVTIRYGQSDLASVAVQMRLSEQVIVHPSFIRNTDNSLLNDIALLKTDTPIVFGNDVQPICLPEFSDRAKRYPGSAEITGWGKLSNTLPITPNLQEAKALMLDLPACKRRTNDSVTFRQLCSDPVTGMSVCPGDSGTPLKLQDTDNRYTQIGLVSYGSSSCEADGEFAVYTRIDQYLEWIRDNSDVTILT